jgi:hypothetical protein
MTFQTVASHQPQTSHTDTIRAFTHRPQPLDTPVDLHFSNFLHFWVYFPIYAVTCPR